MLNLWDPSAHLGFVIALLTAALLGVLHGITPDEHTWPITFSYSVGSYSSRGGMRSGFAFSAAFTLQRAIAAELAYLLLGSVLALQSAQAYLYVVIGLIMSGSAVYILRLGRHIHFLQPFFRRFSRRPDSGAAPAVRPLSWKMASVHGFVAGWGTGAFALIVYTVLTPQMPSAALGFLPGLLFGVGTMLTQMAIGAAVGHFVGRMRVDPALLPVMARRIAANVLLYGGLAFVAAGGLEIWTPLSRWGIETPLHVHNLHTIGVGTVLAVGIVFGVATVSFAREFARMRSKA